MYELQSPNSKITVRPGNIIKLNRFDDECWIVNLGWFSYAGNRPINGWYLVSKSHKDKVKPLNLSDLDDVYVIEVGEAKEDYKELDPEIKKLIHDLKVQVEELSREVAQLTAEVEAKDEVIAQKGQEILALQRQINDLAAEIAALEAQHNLDVETIETLNSQVRAQAEIIAEKAAEIRELTARVAELAEKNELLTQQHQDDFATISQQASTIQEQAESIASLTDDNNRLTDENDRLTEENTELVAQHQEDTATITEQQETISTQSEQITELSGEVQELSTENTRLENLTDTQRETIQNMLDNPPQPKLETPDIIVPEAETRQYTPQEGYDGFASFTVQAFDYSLLKSICERPSGFNLTLPSYVHRASQYLCSGWTGLISFVATAITSIGSNCFSGCTNLKKVVLNEGVLSIEKSAFYNCSNLEEINFPSSLTDWGNYIILSGCTSLLNVTLGNNFNCNGVYLSYSSRFTAETIVACLEALADRTGQTAYTIAFGTTNLNKLTAEQKAIATNKNWNLA